MLLPNELAPPATSTYGYSLVNSTVYNIVYCKVFVTVYNTMYSREYNTVYRRRKGSVPHYKVKANVFEKVYQYF